MDILSKSVSNSKVSDNRESAAAYLRVSSIRQSEEGYSLESQFEYAQKYADNNNYKIEYIFREEKPATQIEGHRVDREDMIGSFRDRPELANLLSIVQSKKIKHLIIYSRDRLSRVVEDALALELFFLRFQVEIHYIKEGEDFKNTDPKIKRLLHLIFTSLAELEVNTLSSRVKDGMRSGVYKGRWVGGKVPFGYNSIRHEDRSGSRKKWITTIQPSEFESNMVKKTFELYAQGMGYKRISDEMNNIYPFIKWTKSKIEGIIKNKTYTGKIVWDRRGGRRNPGKRNSEPLLSSHVTSDPIIDETLWEDIFTIRESRDESRDPHYYDTDYVLKDILVCPKCKNKMKVRNPGTSRTPVYKCAKSAEDRKTCNQIIPCHVAEKAVFEHFREEFIKLDNTDYFWERYTDEIEKLFEDNEKNKADLEKRYKEAKGKADNISKHIEEEKKETLAKVLEYQKSVYSNLASKYKSSLEKLKQSNNVNKIDRQQFEKIINLFIPAIMLNNNSKEVIRIKREFIINFVEEIKITYDKDLGNVNINSIKFATPKFI